MDVLWLVKAILTGVQEACDALEDTRPGQGSCAEHNSIGNTITVTGAG